MLQLRRLTRRYKPRETLVVTLGKMLQGLAGQPGIVLRQTVCVLLWAMHCHGFGTGSANVTQDAQLFPGTLHFLSPHRHWGRASSPLFRVYHTLAPCVHIAGVATYRYAPQRSYFCVSVRSKKIRAEAAEVHDRIRATFPCGTALH